MLSISARFCVLVCLSLSLSGAFFHIDEFVIKSRILGELREHIIITFFVRSREKRPLF